MTGTYYKYSLFEFIIKLSWTYLASGKKQTAPSALDFLYKLLDLSSFKADNMAVFYPLKYYLNQNTDENGIGPNTEVNTIR